MKALTNLTFIVLFSFSTQAQYNPDTPWMENLNTTQSKSSKASKTTFNDVVEAFNNYWKDKDPSKKGSGFKPFKRWENYWKYFVKDDGTLPTNTELWNTWLDAKQFSAQNSAMFTENNWQAIGPFSHTNTDSWSSGQGRINAILVDPSTPTTYYAGAPAGGIWKSTDSGATWTPLSDDLLQIGVSGIAVDHTDSNIIYIATGDDDGWDTYSVGVMKSTDGGSTWNTTGLNTSAGHPTNMNDIYMHPSNTQTLWVATNKGVYKTTDGGANWDNTNGTENLNIKDIKLKPEDPNTIYAVTSNTLYVSTDAGETFTNTGFGTGLPASSNRLVIDVTPDNNSVVYVLSALNNTFQGLYKSTDSGVNFTQKGASTPSNVDLFDDSQQAYYDMALAVSDADENEIYVGVLNIWKSINGGASFTKVNEWSAPNSASYSHADIHLLRFYNGTLFAGTDGGFYRTTDGGTNFTDLTAGMQIGQFYRLSVSQSNSQSMVGGLQDNGGYAYNNNNWLVYYGADGMDTAIHPEDPDRIYGFIQYGSNMYISTDNGTNRDFSVSIPEEEIDTDNGDNGGNWVTPLVMNRDGELYAGYSSLYKLDGSSWIKVSSSFGNNVNIDVLEIDPVNPDYIYVAINNSLRKSTDRGISFSTVNTTFTSNITSIAVNSNDSDVVYVSTSGYNGKVFKSTDGGNNFTDITGSLPNNITKNIIKHQGLHNDNPLFLGTSLGVYRYDDASGIWEAYDNNLPNVSVSDLEINLNDGNITAATYGRGVWQSDIPTETVQHEISLTGIEDAYAVIACGSMDTAKALVKNLGTDPITEVSITYTLNGNTNNTTWNGSIAPNATQLIDIPSVALSGSGLQELKVNASITNDNFAGNNERITSFYANNTGAFNSVNTFENPSDELLTFYEGTNSTNGYWQRGVATGTVLNTETPENNVYGTNLSGEYDNNIKSYLVTPCYDLSILSNPIFKFNMAYDLEFEWDIMYIEYSTDTGLNWQVLGTANDANWYNSSKTPSNNCFNCPGAQWTGTDTTMQQYSYDLTPLNSSSNIVFRFVFHSDQGVVNEGVIIDDFSIEGTLGISEFDTDVFRIYPNPSEQIFNIKAIAISSFDFNITDITGKLVLKQQNATLKNSIYQLDMSDFASGIYFMNLVSGTSKVTKKIILK